MTDYNKEEFDAAVQAKVEEVLSSREEEQARRIAEEALQEAKETFETLRASIETKDAKIKEYEEALANLDSNNPSEAEVAANEKIVELEKEVEKWKNEAQVAQTALDVIAREETASNRMSELEEAGLVLDGEASEAQYAKVRDLDDEAFAAYKSELLALKSKYFSSSDEEEENTPEALELSDDQIKEIAKDLGCDPADSKCLNTVKAVAEKIAEVYSSNKDVAAEEDVNNQLSTKDEPSQQRETASEEMSLGEAIGRSIDQEMKPGESFKDKCTQAWEEHLASKRGEKSK